MLFDARQVRDSKTIESDICIVGAGPAGITLALELANTPFSICLLESGGFDYDEEIQSLNKGDVHGRTYYELVTTRLRYFGGTTNHWEGMCRPLDAIDFEERPFMPFSGWPITLQDLEPYYPKAMKLCQLQSTSFEVSDHQEELPQFFNEHIRAGRTTTRIWNMSPPTRFGWTYRESIVKAENILLYLYTNVVEIETNDHATTATRLRIANLSGSRFWVKAKLFILAAGGIEVSRLLLASNARRPHGLGNDSDQVGRYFMLHPQARVGRILTTEKGKALFAQKTDDFSYWSPIRYGVSVSEKLQRAEGLPNHVMFFQKGLDESPESVKALKRLLRGEDQDIIGELRKVLSDLGAIADRLYDKFFEKDEPEMLRAELKLDHAPNPDSRIMLGTRRDALGMPQPILDWRLEIEEKRAVRRTTEILGEVLGAMEIGRLKLEKWLLSDDNIWPDDIGSYHHMGGTRMSSSSKTGVVNSECRVHGISNLFIASSSVFPTSGFSNPTLTIVALALRLADHLKKVAS